MHLRHIYCKIKQRIHEDDKSHKLIKIVHICGWWLVDGGNGMKYSFYESLSPLFGQHEDMAIYIYIIIYFFMDIDVSIFFSFFLGHASWACCGRTT